MKKFFSILLLLMFSISSSFANNDVVFDGSTQMFRGSFSLIAFYQSCGIIIFAIGVLTSIKLALGAFRSPYGSFTGMRGRY